MQMSPRQQRAPVHRHTAAVVATAVALLAIAAGGAQAADDLPYTLAREGFFYVGGKPTVVNGRTYMAGQMYVDVRIPAKQTQPYPIIMVHGGTRSATTFFGTPDGREGWAQYFVRQGYAVYVVDQRGVDVPAILPSHTAPGRCPMATAVSAATSRRPSTNCGRRRISIPNGQAVALPMTPSHCR